MTDLFAGLWPTLVALLFADSLPASGRQVAVLYDRLFAGLWAAGGRPLRPTRCQPLGGRWPSSTADSLLVLGGNPGHLDGEVGVNAVQEGAGGLLTAQHQQLDLGQIEIKVLISKYICLLTNLTLVKHFK